MTNGQGQLMELLLNLAKYSGTFRSPRVGALSLGAVSRDAAGVRPQRSPLDTRPEKTGATRGDRYATLSLYFARLSSMKDTRTSRSFVAWVVTLAIFAVISNAWGTADAAMDAEAVATISPEEGLIESSLYVPGTEEVGTDEMRVVALGTGMPSARPKQAGACWLVELGNGDKFLFDIGSECHSRIAAQKIAYDYLDKVFITHLHVDHMGDLGSFWLGGATMNRTTPLRVWGPSGPEEIYGTRYSLTKLQEMYGWDIHTRGAVQSREKSLCP